MKTWTAFWSILKMDMATYYLKPPNVSWGIIFPIAWALAFFLRTGSPVDLRQVLPGVIGISVLFGTTSMLAVTVTFERKGRSFERLLLAPIPLEILMLAKTSGAIIFGVANAFVPVALAAALGDVGGIDWSLLVPCIILVAMSSTFMGLFVAVSVSEVFEAQTFSNFFRFPMIFLCGLFVPLERLPDWLRPVSYALPLTYGADILHGSVRGAATMPAWLDFAALSAFTLGLFAFSLRNVRRRWIL